MAKSHFNKTSKPRGAKQGKMGPERGRKLGARVNSRTQSASKQEPKPEQVARQEALASTSSSRERAAVHMHPMSSDEEG